MNITFAEVREWVESLADDEYVGTCNSPYSCIIAQAIKHKYPDVLSVDVLPRFAYPELDMYAVTPDHFKAIISSPDEARLNKLAKAFDALNAFDQYNRVTKSQAMPLFEEEV